MRDYGWRDVTAAWSDNAGHRPPSDRETGGRLRRLIRVIHGYSVKPRVLAMGIYPRALCLVRKVSRRESLIRFVTILVPSIVVSHTTTPNYGNLLQSIGVAVRKRPSHCAMSDYCVL